MFNANCDKIPGIVKLPDISHTLCNTHNTTISYAMHN